MFSDLDSLLCHRREQVEDTLTPSQSSSMSGLKREMSPDQVNGGGEQSTRERRSSFSSSTTGDSGYGGSVLGSVFLEHKTMQHYETGDDYLLAMLEDLADWFSNIYDLDVTAETLFSQLESGALLCRHAHEVQKAGDEYIKLNQRRDLPMKVGNQTLVIPSQAPNYRANAQPGTFVARDNVANFIHWCRAFGIPDCLSFETEDLVLRKNVRSVVLCLLEIGRVGAKFGMEAPDLVMMEAEIDAEIEADAARARAEAAGEADDDYELVEEEYYDDGEEEEEEDDNGVKEDALELAEGEDQLGSLRRSRLPVSRIPRAQPIGPQGLGDEQTFDVTDAARKGRRRVRRWVRRPKVERAPFQAPPLIPQPLNNARKQRPRPKCDMKSLDEMVRDIIKECTCDETFPMKRLGEGKYQFGDNSTLIFVRILRYHVMVRVGGGWDTLNHFLEKYDPCRKNRPNGSKAPCTHAFGISSRDQSEEPRPLRTSTPRKASTPIATASCIEELDQRPAPVNRNFKEGMLNFNRSDSRGRTVSVDTGLPPVRPPTLQSSSAKITLVKPAEAKSPPQSISPSLQSLPQEQIPKISPQPPTPEKEEPEVVKKRHGRSKTVDSSQQPTTRIGSLYLHNTVDDLRRHLHDFQSSLKSNESSREDIVESLAPAAASSEVLSAREMYERMQRDFDMMRMGVDVTLTQPKQDEDTVSVTSSCSSTSSTGKRFVSRIPVPSQSRQTRTLSNPTTPEMTRRKPRAGSLQPEVTCPSSGSGSRPPRVKGSKPLDRRRSMDTGRQRPAVELNRRGSMSSTKVSSIANGTSR